MHVLDIANNSITAHSTLLEIIIDTDTNKNRLSIVINDNGKGMSDEFLEKVRNPFTTSRTTRAVGLGIPLFEQSALSTGGGFDITSVLGNGTTVTAWFVLDHIDRQPLGDMPSTITTLIQGSPETELVFRQTVDNQTFELDTRQIREILQGVSLGEPDVIKWLYEYIEEGINNIGGNRL